MLDLIATHRDLVRLEHQDVCTHQHGVHEQTGRDIGIGVLLGRMVFVDGGFVGMCTVEHAFACDASQEPGQFGNFGNVRLPVKSDDLGVQARRDPTGGNLQCGALDASRIVAFNQGMVVGQKVKTFGGRIATRLHCGPNSTDVITQMGCAGGGDACEHSGAFRVHGFRAK